MLIKASEAPLPKIWRENPQHTIKPIHLSDEEFGRALQRFPINCVDIVPFNATEQVIYLAKRAVYPMKGYWWFGGGINPVENYLAAVTRKLKEETNTVISTDRIYYVSCERWVWERRKQAPQEAGSDGTSYIFAFEPTQEELGNLGKNMVESEYEPGSLQKFSRNDLLQAKLHPAILAIYDLIFPDQH